MLTLDKFVWCKTDLSRLKLHTIRSFGTANMTNLKNETGFLKQRDEIMVKSFRQNILCAS